MNMNESKSAVDLSTFTNRQYQPGRGWFARLMWYAVSLLVFESGWVPVSGVKVRILRWFGGQVGRGVVIKPHVRIKYPWRLSVGDHCWIGQQAWIDNLDDVRFGNHVCVSQGVYLCTGSHDHRRSTFDLITRPITLEDGVWLGARALVLPGVHIGSHAVVAAGAVVTKDVPAAAMMAGSPARVTGQRTIEAG